MHLLWQRYRVPVLVLAVTALLVAVLALMQAPPPHEQAPEKSWRVQTLKLPDRAQRLAPQLRLDGQVEAAYHSDLAAVVSADVKAVHVREGQSVGAGALLVELDDSDLRLLLAQRQAAVDEAQAQIDAENIRHQNDLQALKLEQSLVKVAERKLAREKKTSQNKLTSLSSVDTQQQALDQQRLALRARRQAIASHPARLAQLQARLQTAQAALAQARKDLDRSQLRAHFQRMPRIQRPGGRPGSASGAGTRGHASARRSAPAVETTWR